MWSSISAEKAPEPLPEGSVREKYVEDLLGPARPPRIPINLMERRHQTTGGVETGELGQRVVDMLHFLRLDR
jgi:hypothetical protein